MNKFLTSSQRVLVYANLYKNNAISIKLKSYGKSLEIIENNKDKHIVYSNSLYGGIASCLIQLGESDVAQPFITNIKK